MWGAIHSITLTLPGYAATRTETQGQQVSATPRSTTAYTGGRMAGTPPVRPTLLPVRQWTVVPTACGSREYIARSITLLLWGRG
jgi:hypothetical protein